MTKRQLEEKINELETKVATLQRLNDFMFSELTELSQGIGVKPDYMTTAHAWEVAIKNKAAIAVRKAYSMVKP